MKILVCGSRGFIGRHLVKELEQAGHVCIRAVRKARSGKAGKVYISVDFSKDLTVESWLPRLKDIDVVVNAIGILRESSAYPMGDIQAKAPAALFAACARAGVKRVVQISALGVAGEIDTRYFRTKLFAEQALIKLKDQLNYLILQPSVVYGENGDSAKMFRMMARLPIHALPMGGQQKMQPVHIDDLAMAVCNWVGDTAARSATVIAAGSDVVTMQQMLASYREQMGYGPAFTIPVPGFLVKFGAWCGDSIPVSPLCTETLRMLNAGSVGDNTAFTALLGHTPGSVHTFIKGNQVNVESSDVK